jgi:hypothetical protein
VLGHGSQELREAIGMVEVNRRIEEAMVWGKPMSMDDFNKIFPRL